MSTSHPKKLAARSSPLRMAVIGAGRIARQHLACAEELTDAEVAGVCDLSAASARAAADRHGVSRWFTDHHQMLAEVQPDIVHITTPPASHYSLALDALAAGADVFVEKPAAESYQQVSQLIECARAAGRVLTEDYNYVFDSSVQRILQLVASGEFGAVLHVEVTLCLDILSSGSPYADPHVPHPSLALPGGAISDFLSHLASLAYFFIGPHKTVQSVWQKRDASSILPYDEFRALIHAERATATLAFSAHAQPDQFAMRVYGTRMRAAASLFEPRLTIEKVYPGPKPLNPLRNGWQEARDVRRAACAGLWRKLSGGPGSYEGLWQLMRETYRSLRAGTGAPITLQHVDDVNRMVEAIVSEARVAP